MIEKKLTKRQMKALETKEALYKAAIDLFNEVGYENVHIEDITNAANTAKGTFYTYFESKKALLYHTFDKFDQMYEDVYDEVKTLPTFEERLLAFIEKSYEELFEIGKKIPWALYHNSMLDKDPMIVRNDRVLYRVITEMVEFGIKNGELSSNKEHEYYLELIKTQIIGIDYRWCISSEEIGLSRFARDNMSILIKGLLNS